ncbi:MAG: H(+)/Cl(-) exchange transporter ClcA [Fimbriimonas sp.]|nr:H(+)/Cl(-) exchange transporter ClcA [Fimbriimonas sp.]
MNELEPVVESIAAAGKHEASTELREYLSNRDDRHRVFPKAALVGFASGAVAVAFRALLALCDFSRTKLALWSHSIQWIGWLAPVTYSAVCAGLAFFVVRKWAPEAAGSGIPHVEAVLRRHRKFRWRAVLPVKFFGGILAIGGGLGLGREGPTVQMGGAVGAGIARLLKVGTQERLVLVAAGAGAGLAAAFNAPLAGLIFVLEELQRDFRPMVFGAAFIAAASADVVSRLFSGQLAVFAAPAYPAPALSHLPLFALLGVVTGIMGVAFNRGLVSSLDFFARFAPRYHVLKGVAVGAAAGLLTYFSPQLVGSGHSLAEAALSAKIALSFIPLFFLGRFVLTLGSYGSGAPGGIFSPLLALGALLGLGVGDVARMVLPHAGVSPGAFAVVGMAAYFSAIVRAPLTGIVLIVEMTSSYALSLPLLVACFCAYGAAEAMKDLPIYETLLQRELAKEQNEALTQQETVVLELEVEGGSPFDGQKLRDVGLPPGVLLVSCRDGYREWLPDADTKLQAHMRITAVVSMHSDGGMEALREGCRRYDGD